MKLTYVASFSFGPVTRTSHHKYKTAAAAVKDGRPYANPTFSASRARAVLPGDGLRRQAAAACYSSNERARFRKEAEILDAGWVVEVVPVIEASSAS